MLYSQDIMNKVKSKLQTREEVTTARQPREDEHEYLEHKYNVLMDIDTDGNDEETFVNLELKQTLAALSKFDEDECIHLKTSISLLKDKIKNDDSLKDNLKKHILDRYIKRLEELKLRQSKSITHNVVRLSTDDNGSIASLSDGGYDEDRLMLTSEVQHTYGGGYISDSSSSSSEEENNIKSIDGDSIGGFRDVITNEGVMEDYDEEIDKLIEQDETSAPTSPQDDIYQASEWQ